MQANLSIYIIAIGGSGTAPLACLLQQAGQAVSGSDGPLYPPMSTLLERHGIRPHVGYDAEHLEPPPDLVIVGNAVPRDNVESRAAEERGLPMISMPGALRRFFLEERRPLVVAGTHGKTTTTAMAAHVWTHAGRDPGYLIGGWPHDLPASFQIRSGDRFIVEGDEYNAAWFDRGPKFLHYCPETLILTSVEYDHADLYPDPGDLRAAFRSLIATLPADGLLVACGDSESVREVAAGAPCRTLFYGLREGNDLAPASPVDYSQRTTRALMNTPEGEAVELTLALPGQHNLSNALAVWAAARADGIASREIAAALASFSGVRRRLERIGSVSGIDIIDDFAHHPTAVAATLKALRQRYPERRLVTLFEPRSLTAGRRLFQERYLEAFALADLVFLAPIYHAERLGPEESLDLEKLAARLSATGTTATRHDSIKELLDSVVSQLRPGDVVVTMSSGSFEDLPRRVLEALEDSSGSEESDSPQARFQQSL